MGELSRVCNFCTEVEFAIQEEKDVEKGPAVAISSSEVLDGLSLVDGRWQGDSARDDGFTMATTLWLGQAHFESLA